MNGGKDAAAMCHSIRASLSVNQFLLDGIDDDDDEDEKSWGGQLLENNIRPCQTQTRGKKQGGKPTVEWSNKWVSL